MDSAARIVRRANAGAHAERAAGAFAARPRLEYSVREDVAVMLRAMPSRAAPLTGYALEGGASFAAEEDLLDASGDLWVKVAPAADERREAPEERPAALRVRDGDRVDLSGLGAGRHDLAVGARVVRGPSWRYRDQDGGPAAGGARRVGTVLRTQHGRQVIVQWENGHRANYRADGLHADLAYAGDQALRGAHRCVRDLPVGAPLDLTLVRADDVSDLEGAIVRRGPHWRWSEQDGGDGNEGRVVGLRPNEGLAVVVCWGDANR